MKELYTKVSPNLDFVDREKATRRFWEENRIFEKSAIRVLSDGEPLASFPRAHMAPGEMEQVILTKKKLAEYPNLQKITICIEEA